MLNADDGSTEMIEGVKTHDVIRPAMAWLAWFFPLFGWVASGLCTNHIPVSMHPFSPFFLPSYAIFSVVPASVGPLIGLVFLLPSHRKNRAIVIHASAGVVISALSLLLAFAGTPTPKDIVDPF